jgi:hypothetical protein
VQNLARTAVEHFDRIDVWVNCAGVIAYGPFEQVPSEVFRAVLAARGSYRVDGAWRRDRRRELLRAALTAARAGIHSLLHGPGS